MLQMYAFFFTFQYLFCYNNLEICPLWVCVGMRFVKKIFYNCIMFEAFLNGEMVIARS